MNIKMSRKVIERTIDSGIAIMIWGPPGIGKSSIVSQIASDRDSDRKKYPKGYGFVDVRLPQLDPTDLRGIPVPDREKNVCLWYPPEFLPNDRGSFPPNGILFLDEIEKAIPAVKNAALQLVLDRKLGNYKLPDGWSIVAAGNREEDGAFSQPIGSALANRMTHIEAECDHEVWLEWARKNGIQSDIVGYIEFQAMSALLPNNKEKSGTGRINAFATPRSWHMASDLIADIAHSNFADRQIMVASAVGEHMANTFIQWDKHYRSVDPKAIIEKKMTKAYKQKLENKMKKSVSFKFAVAMACSNYVSNMKSSAVKKCSNNLTDFLHMVSPDLRVVFFRNIPVELACDVTTDKKIMEAVKDVLELAND